MTTQTLTKAEVTARRLESIAAIEPTHWSSIYGAAAEGGDYLRACEEASPPSFTLSAVAAFTADRLIAGGPVFETAIKPGLVLDGIARRIVESLGQILPSIATIPIVGIGTPYSHDSMLGFAAGLPPGEREQALEAVIGALETFAAARHAEVILLKDVSKDVVAWADAPLRKRGFSRITALPIATLPVPDTDTAYIEGLSANMRSNLRRRLKRAKNVRIEVLSSTDGLDSELNALRARTLDRAANDYDVFEEIAPSYYAAVLKNLRDRARLLTYWVGDTLIGFSLVILGPDKLVQTYNGMRYPEGPDNGLFYLDWMTQLQLCIEHRIPVLQSGATTYLIKARLGCKFKRSYVYVRHRNRIMNALLKTASPFIDMERSDASLKELGSSAPFV